MFFQSFMQEMCGCDFLPESKKRKGVEDTPQKEILSLNVSHKRKIEGISPMNESRSTSPYCDTVFHPTSLVLSFISSG